MSEMKIRTRAGISVHRIELADGQLPELACGVNGVAYQKWFRPTHIDVEFDPAGVVEMLASTAGVWVDPVHPAHEKIEQALALARRGP